MNRGVCGCVCVGVCAWEGTWNLWNLNSVHILFFHKVATFRQNTFSRRRVDYQSTILRWNFLFPLFFIVCCAYRGIWNRTRRRRLLRKIEAFPILWQILESLLPQYILHFKRSKNILRKNEIFKFPSTGNCTCRGMGKCMECAQSDVLSTISNKSFCFLQCLIRSCAFYNV